MSGLGFDKSRRILKRADFLRAYASGRRHTTRHFILFVLPRPEDGPWRLGLAVSRKLGSAVRRNRIKRVVREFFRVHQHEITEGRDIVVVPKRFLDAGRVGFGMVRKEFMPLLCPISPSPEG